MQTATQGKNKGERAGILRPPWRYSADRPGKIHRQRTLVTSELRSSVSHTATASSHLGEMLQTTRGRLGSETRPL